MSIRIYNDGLAGTAASQTTRSEELSRANGTGKTNQSTGVSGQDQVQISSLSEAVASQSTERAARVQDLAAVFQSGRYQVSSDDLGHALVNHSLQSGAVGIE